MYDTIWLHAIASEEVKKKKKKLGMVSHNNCLMDLSFNYSKFSAYANSENVFTSTKRFKTQMTES